MWDPEQLFIGVGRFVCSLVCHLIRNETRLEGNINIVHRHRSTYLPVLVLSFCWAPIIRAPDTSKIALPSIPMGSMQNTRARHPMTVVHAQWVSEVGREHAKRERAIDSDKRQGDILKARAVEANRSTRFKKGRPKRDAI